MQSTNVLKRLINGGDSKRATRFHDENNVLRRMERLRHIPHAAWTTAGRVLFGRLPLLPWWPYSAIQQVSKIVLSDTVVVEFGAGMSSLWLAMRARKVYAIEDSPKWHGLVQDRARTLGLANLVLMLRDSSRFPNRGNGCATFNEEFASFDGVVEPLVDSVIVDGAARFRCVENAIPRLKSGGYLYLDNSDADKDSCYYSEPGKEKEAQRVLLDRGQPGHGDAGMAAGPCPGNLVRQRGHAVPKGLTTASLLPAGPYVERTLHGATRKLKNAVAHLLGGKWEATLASRACQVASACRRW